MDIDCRAHRLIPITYLVLRSSRSVPDGEVAATYGIPQKPAAKGEAGSEKPAAKIAVTTEKEVSDSEHVTHET